MQFTHVSHIFALHVCTVLCATCMLGAHVHVTTMPHACQVHMPVLLLRHMHVKHTCACHYYAT